MELEAVGVTELHFGQRCASTGIVNDVFNDTSNVTVLLCKVKRSKLCWSLVQARMGRWSWNVRCDSSLRVLEMGRTEYGSTTLPLVADHSTHLYLLGNGRQLGETFGFRQSLTRSDRCVWNCNSMISGSEHCGRARLAKH